MFVFRFPLGIIRFYEFSKFHLCHHFKTVTPEKMLCERVCRDGHRETGACSTHQRYAAGQDRSGDAVAAPIASHTHDVRWEDRLALRRTRWSTASRCDGIQRRRWGVWADNWKFVTSRAHAVTVITESIIREICPRVERFVEFGYESLLICIEWKFVEVSWKISMNEKLKN